MGQTGVKNKERQGQEQLWIGTHTLEGKPSHILPSVIFHDGIPKSLAQQVYFAAELVLEGLGVDANKREV